MDLSWLFGDSFKTLYLTLYITFLHILLIKFESMITIREMFRRYIFNAINFNVL